MRAGRVRRRGRKALRRFLILKWRGWSRIISSSN
jgi:hypothetical protein